MVSVTPTVMQCDDATPYSKKKVLSAPFFLVILFISSLALQDDCCNEIAFTIVYYLFFF